ncbi:MAG: carbon-nitrogen hydrolase family protein [Ktedonobacteraceae bacterium]
MSTLQQMPFTVAVARTFPLLLDRAATLEKACELIVDAGGAGARLIVFPATFIPGYPTWVWTTPPGEQSLLNKQYARWLANAVYIPSDLTDRLCRVAKRARINVVIGLNEREGAICYNTLLYIDMHGQFIGKHRALALTGAERLVWAQGDGSTLQVYKLPCGNISGLIGAENYMPLARYALYAWGVQLYIAIGWDRGERWLSTVQHIAREGHVFVLSCGVPLPGRDVPIHFPPEQSDALEREFGEFFGESVIINPNGQIIAGTAREQEEIVYAEIDLHQIDGSKWEPDIIGPGARADIFQLTVFRKPRLPVQTIEGQFKRETESSPSGLTNQSGI